MSAAQGDREGLRPVRDSHILRDSFVGIGLLSCHTEELWGGGEEGRGRMLFVLQLHWTANS